MAMIGKAQSRNYFGIPNGLQGDDESTAGPIAAPLLGGQGLQNSGPRRRLLQRFAGVAAAQRLLAWPSRPAVRPSNRAARPNRPGGRRAREGTEPWHPDTAGRQ